MGNYSTKHSAEIICFEVGGYCFVYDIPLEMCYALTFGNRHLLIHQQEYDKLKDAIWPYLLLNI